MPGGYIIGSIEYQSRGLVHAHLALFDAPISDATDGLIDTLIKWGVDVTVNNEADCDFTIA